MRKNTEQDLRVITDLISEQPERKGLTPSTSRAAGDRSADFVGTCGYCGRQYFQLNYRNNTLSDHGFRLIWGARTGSCPGSHDLSLEESPSTLELLISDLEFNIVRLEQTLERLDVAKKFTFPKRTFNHRRNKFEIVPVTVEAGDPRFEQHKEAQISETQQQILHFEDMLLEKKKELLNWSPSPLLSSTKASEKEQLARESSKRREKKDRYEEKKEKAVSLINKKFSTLLKREKLFNPEDSNSGVDLEYSLMYLVESLDKGSTLGSAIGMSQEDVLVDMDVTHILKHLGLKPSQVRETNSYAGRAKNLYVRRGDVVEFIYPGLVQTLEALPTKPKKKKVKPRLTVESLGRWDGLGMRYQNYGRDVDGAQYFVIRKGRKDAPSYLSADGSYWLELKEVRFLEAGDKPLVSIFSSEAAAEKEIKEIKKHDY